MAHVVIACLNAAGAGSVAAAARWQAAVLSEYYEVSLISDTLPEDLGNIRGQCVSSPNLRWLRRYAHVPTEVVVAYRIQKAIAGLHNQYPVDLVIVHNHSLIGVWVPRSLRNVSVLMVVHADIFDKPLDTYDSRVTAFYKWAAPRAYSRSKLVVANSSYTAAQVRQLAGDTPVEFLYVPVELSDIEGSSQAVIPRDLTNDGSVFRILYVGRLAPEKGIATLLEAIRLLLAKKLPIELFIVGEGPLAGRVDAVSQELMNDNIKIHRLPWQPRNHLASWYRSVDVLCVPSRSESLGLVAIEALLCGLSVVASDVGGLREVVRPEKDGVLVPPDDPLRLAEAIEQTYHRAHSISHDLDHAWLSQFSPETVKSGLRSLVDRIIAVGARR